MSIVLKEVDGPGGIVPFIGQTGLRKQEPLKIFERLGLAGPAWQAGVFAESPLTAFSARREKARSANSAVRKLLLT